MHYRLRRIAEGLVSEFVPGMSIGREVADALAQDRTPFVTFGGKECLDYYSNVSPADLLKLPRMGAPLLVPVVLAPGIEEPLALGDVMVRRKEGAFELPPVVNGLTRQYLTEFARRAREAERKEPRDDELVRPISVIEENGQVWMEFERTSYFLHIRTNLMLDYREGDQLRSLREVAHRDRVLPPLGASPLSDHLGVDTLVFTSDGHLILSVRARELNVTPGRLGPGAAGAVQYPEWPPTTSVGTLSDLDPLHETRQELGLVRKDFDYDNTLVLGVGRDVMRGGKPQLFLETHTYRTANDILHLWKRRAETAWEHKDLIAEPLPSGLDPRNSDPGIVEVWLRTLVGTKGKNMTEPLLGLLSTWWTRRGGGTA